MTARGQRKYGKGGTLWLFIAALGLAGALQNGRYAWLGWLMFAVGLGVCIVLWAIAMAAESARIDAAVRRHPSGKVDR